MKKSEEKRKKLFDYIVEYISDKGYSPSIREMADFLEVSSSSTIANHLDKLTQSGLIKRDKSKPRAIEIVGQVGPAFEFVDVNKVTKNDTMSVVKVPIIGQVAAGQPIYAEENYDGYFPIPEHMLPKGNCFLLKVKGDSMINDNILDGDMIFVESTKVARNGERVVAIIDDSATVKTFYKEKDYFRLQPENDELPPIIVNHLTIIGRVIGLLRMY